MSTSSSQPPGWYAAAGDPPGTQRWWDGEQWVGGPVAAAPPAGSFGAPPPYGYAPTSGPAPAYSYGGTFGYATYAGWWRRVGAAVLDGLILGVPSGIVNTIVQAAVPTRVTRCTTFDEDVFLCERPTNAGSVIILLVSVALFVGGVAYYAYFIGTRGQTLGKQAVGISVYDERTGRPIGTGRAIGRYFGSLVSYLACFLGILWPLWDTKKQTWHDKMVNSVVVRTG